MLHGQSSTTEQTPKKAQEQQLNRACEACRLSKVRCLVDPASGSSQCQRCTKAGRACVFAPPTKRRQRKRTDVRVAELEREIKQMRSLLKPNRISPVEVSDHESMDEEPGEQDEHLEKESPTYAQGHESTTTPATATLSDKWPTNRAPNECPPAVSPGNCAMPESLGSSEMDIIDQGLITQEMAEDFLNIYRTELAHECPGVVVSNDWTASQLRVKKPALFYAIMAAAAHSKGATLSDKLHKEAMYLYARKIFIGGEKSLQYIQALLVTVAYYTPPNSPAHLQIYQLGNLAASMALELGLASKPRTHEQLPKRAIRSLQRISSAEELLENCRTILVLYNMTAGFAMRLKRQSILIFNSWMEEALSLLEKSPLLDDRRVVAWVKLQRIADEANTAFGFDDASTSFSLSELRLQVILRIFERRMQDWKKSIPPEVMSLSLEVEYYQNIISMWEFAMDGGRYDAPDYRNRHLTLPALDDDCVQPESLLSRSALQINATIKCVSAAHALLDCFRPVNNARLQKAPSVQFVRAIYALVVLMKADYAVGTDAEGIGEVLDSQSLKVDYYLDMVLNKASEAIGPQNCRVPSHWLFILQRKLKSWHDEHQQLRRDGRHLKRKTSTEEESSMPSEPAPTPFSDTKPKTGEAIEHLPTHNSSSTEQPQSQIPNFNINSPYPVWPTPPTADASFAPMDSTQSMATGASTDQPGSFADMSDFSASFQNGDLYLWNDVNDNVTGWITQGLYNDMQFTGFNGM